ncbi:MAG: hypothetical protein ACPG52_05620 [Cognaticolwellia sp.]
MKTSKPDSYLRQKQALKKLLTALYVWLRITLSYCVVGGVITSLVSAYLQSVNIVVITLIMATFLGLGAYNAEMARGAEGLNRYLAKMTKQHHQNY